MLINSCRYKYEGGRACSKYKRPDYICPTEQKTFARNYKRLCRPKAVTSFVAEKEYYYFVLAYYTSPVRNKCLNYKWKVYIKHYYDRWV